MPSVRSVADSDLRLLVHNCVLQLSAIIRVFSLAGRQDLCRQLAERLVEQLAGDARWSRRQMYVYK